MNLNFLREIPKAELNLSFVKSVPMDVIIKLAEDNSIILPTYDEEDLKREIFLKENLDKFFALLKKEKDISFALQSLVEKALSYGIKHLEIKLCPYDFVSDELNLEAVFRVLEKTVSKIKKELKKRYILNTYFDIAFIFMIKDGFTFYKNEYTKKLENQLPYLNEDKLNTLLFENILQTYKKLGSPKSIRGIDYYGMKKRQNIGTFMLYSSFQNFKNEENFIEKILEFLPNRIVYSDLIFLQNDECFERFLKFFSRMSMSFQVDFAKEFIKNDFYSNARLKIEKLLDKNVSFTISSSSLTFEDPLLNYNNFIESNNLSSFAFKKIILEGFRKAFINEGYASKKEKIRLLIAQYGKLEKKYKLGFIPSEIEFL